MKIFPNRILQTYSNQKSTSPQSLRKYLLSAFLLLFLGLDLILTIYNIFEFFFSPRSDLSLYVLEDIVVMVLFGILYFLNHRGYTIFAVFTTIVLSVLGVSLLVVPVDPNSGLIILLFLVFIPWFILQPFIAFVLVTFSVVFYHVTFFLSHPIKEYNPMTIPLVIVVVVASRVISKQLEEMLEKFSRSSAQYLELFDNVPIGLFRSEPSGKILDANPALVNMFGYESLQDFLAVNAIDLYASSTERDKHLAAIEGEDGFHHHVILFKRRNGSHFWAEERTHTVRTADGRVRLYEGSIVDITHRKMAEEALRVSESRLELFFSQSLDGFFFMMYDEPIQWDENADKEQLLDYALENERVTKVNQALLDQYGLAEELALGLTPNIIFAHDLPLARRIWREMFEKGNAHVIAEERKSDGTPMWTEGDYICLYDSDERITGHFGIQREITERKKSEERINSQLARLASLRAIDATISGSTNLQLALHTILDQVIVRLKVDSAEIYLFRSEINTLERAYSLGRPRLKSKASIHLNQQLPTAQVIRERRPIAIHDNPEQSEMPVACYYGFPLIVKGKARGVLQVFRDNCQGHDSEWDDFLGAYANQAAIAIDNASMYEETQHANTELIRAYETTIDGWSHALDLRDKETEGHTQRVTKLTMQIARSIGFSDEELLNIRRGSMLHDIGKMGIPDYILFKSDSLTEEEWEALRKHPVFAYELLSPIEYLRDALDIPHYHHEKWDGTGYPYGLEGESIPLAARIFSVVDVYDALTSDRPYRKAWSKERTLKHIQSLSGSHFDPMVVDLFLSVMKDK